MSQPAHVAIIMPCFNEEAVLLRSCSSLGFGPETQTSRADNATLILVNNASEDSTLSVMEAIRGSSPAGSVLIAQENTRGYVPPRRRGATVAAELCRDLGVSAREFLTLQVDADTSYLPGYVQAMVAASAAGSNIFLEGVSEPEPLFVESWPNYIRFVDGVDRRIFELLPPAPLDIIADDKVCGYFLSDYIQWGGHVRAFDVDGDEMHAESSRLLTRALAFGATKIAVSSAVAQTSCRRIVENPALFFSTAGFPHGEHWKAAWREQHGGEFQAIPEFLAAANGQMPNSYTISRCLHCLLLFSILPRQVAAALGLPLVDFGILQALQEQIDRELSFSKSDLLTKPESVFERGLAFMSANELLLRLLVAKTD